MFYRHECSRVIIAVGAFLKGVFSQNPVNVHTQSSMEPCLKGVFFKENLIDVC